MVAGDRHLVRLLELQAEGVALDAEVLLEVAERAQAVVDAVVDHGRRSRDEPLHVRGQRRGGGQHGVAGAQSGLVVGRALDLIEGEENPTDLHGLNLQNKQEYKSQQPGDNQ